MLQLLSLMSLESHTLLLITLEFHVTLHGDVKSAPIAQPCPTSPDPPSSRSRHPFAYLYVRLKFNQKLACP